MSSTWQRVPEPLTQTPHLIGAGLLLPAAEESWGGMVDAEVAVLLREINGHVRRAFPLAPHRAARRLSYEEQFRLHRIIECLVISGREYELLKSWKQEIENACRAAADLLYADHQQKDLAALASQASDLVDAISSLAVAAAPLDSVYTTRTPFKHTRSISFSAIRTRLQEPVSEPVTSAGESESVGEYLSESAIASLVTHIWARIMEWEREWLHSDHQGLQDTALVLQVRHLTGFLHSLDVVDSSLLNAGVRNTLSVIIKDFVAFRQDHTASPITKLLASLDAVNRWYKDAYVGASLSGITALFRARLKTALFAIGAQDEDKADSSQEVDRPEADLLTPRGVWLTQSHLDRQILTLGPCSVLIDTETWFEWTCLNDPRGWTALNTLARDSGIYTANVLQIWSQMMARTCAQLIDEHTGSKKTLLHALLLWHQLLTSRISEVFPAQQAKHAMEALVSALKNRPVVSEAFAEFVESLWVDGADDEFYVQLLPIFRALPNKTLVQALLEGTLVRTLLTKHVLPEQCNALITLLKKECGENYVSNMLTALREFEVTADSTEHDVLLSVRLVSSRLHNTQCDRLHRVVPDNALIAAPHGWRLPQQLNTMFTQYIDQYRALHTHRLLTFALEVSSALVTDLRTGTVLTVSAAQYLVLDRFNNVGIVDTDQLNETFGDGQGLLVAQSLQPLVLEQSKGVFMLADTPPALLTDYRDKWLAHWAGLEEDADVSATHAALRASIMIFHDVGLDALLMRTLKQKPVEFRLLKTVVEMYSAERLAGHVVSEATLWEHLERLKSRDFVSIDQNLISLGS